MRHPVFLKWLIVSVVAACAVAVVAKTAQSRDSPPPAAGAEHAGTRQGERPITRIQLVLRTGNRSDAGTDGDVFLGVGGREFFVDAPGDHDDFERSATRTYTFGERATVNRPTQNDPRSPWVVDLDAVARTPRYLRFEPGSDWNVEQVDVTVIEASGNSAHWGELEGGEHLWLGERRGKVIYLP